MGIPGLLAILALYGVPLLLFARRLRGAGRCSASAPCAGVLFVATFALCGLTQSMFAHQLSASFYAVMVGLLAGFCMTGRVGERRSEEHTSALKSIMRISYAVFFLK